MSIFGKNYRISDRGNYVNEGVTKKVIKTTLGTALTVALAYYSVKHGLPNTIEHFHEGAQIKDSLSNEAASRVDFFFATLASTPIISVASMFLTGITYNMISAKPFKSRHCILALVATPLILSGFTLHFDPTWSDTLINSFKIIKDYGLGATVGSGSILALTSPLFGYQIANKIEDLLARFPKFNHLSENFREYLAKRATLKEVAKNEKYLQKDKKEFDLYHNYTSICSTLEHHFKENHLNEQQMYFNLNKIYTHSKYILEEGTWERQFEMKKVFNETIPQLISEYTKNLHCLERGIQLEKTKALDIAFNSIEKHLATIVEHVKEHEKTNNTMDFDVALTHIKNQFPKEKKLSHF